MLVVNLIGRMTVRTIGGEQLTPRSRKAQALLAVLCLSRDGERSRKWLQNLLWSDRGEEQGAASLRSSLSEIRNSFGDFKDVFSTDRVSVRLDLKKLRVDVLEMSESEWAAVRSDQSDFLEGFDIRDPEFEDWLRTQRAKWERNSISSVRAGAVNSPVKDPKVDLNAVGNRQDWTLALAVLPLRNETDDLALTFVAEGISEDLIDQLQRVRWLPVIAKSSSFSKLGSSENTQGTFAQELGALYYIVGDVSRSPNGVRVRLRLVQSDNEHLIWTDNFELSELLQDQLAPVLARIAGEIGRSVSQTFQRRLLAQPVQDLEYVDHVWRARWYLGQFTVQDSSHAFDHLSRALELQPNLPEAQIQMGYWHLWRAWVTREADDQGLALAAKHAHAAAALDPDDGRCLAMLGTVRFWRGHHAEAETLFKHAIELTPSLALAHQQLGTVVHYSDRPSEAIAPMRKALRYSPRDQMEFGYQTELAAALFRVGELEEAWERATLGVTKKPRYWYGHLVRIMVSQKIGDPQRLYEARAGLAAADVRPTPEHLNWLPLGRSEFRNELESAIQQSV